MGLSKQVDTLADGTTRTAFVHDGTPSETAVATGPIYGRVTTGDGTSYNVGEDVICVPNAHLGEVMHLIGVRYEQEGHPNHSDDGPDGALGEPFVHICTPVCGDVGRSVDEVADAYNDSLTRLGHDHLIGTPEHDAFVAQIHAKHAEVHALLAEQASNG
jgi:hypothetical protein